jgi:hypothetical protein
MRLQKKAFACKKSITLQKKRLPAIFLAGCKMFCSHFEAISTPRYVIQTNLQSFSCKLDVAVSVQVIDRTPKSLMP